MISINSQPFILFQIENPTRFSTRLFFIVLLAIGMISSANIQIYYKFRSHFHTGITSIVLLSTSNTCSFSCVIIINLLHSNTLDSFNKSTNFSVKCTIVVIKIIANLNSGCPIRDIKIYLNSFVVEENRIITPVFTQQVNGN